MPPRKKTVETLADRVTNEPVRFAMNAGRISLVPMDEVPISVGGRFTMQQHPGVELVREGAYRDEYATRVYDPADSADREIIEFVQEFLSQNPHYAKDVRIGLQIIGVNDVVCPFPNYDNASPEAIVNAVRSMGHPLERIMKYELTGRRNADGEFELREDVVEALNDLDAEMQRSTASRADDRVAL